MNDEKLSKIAEDCKNKIGSIADANILKDILDYILTKQVFIKNEAIPSGSKVWVEFSDDSCPWAAYKGEAIIDDFPEDQSMWVADTGEAHYNCSVFRKGKREEGCYFPVSSIKRIIS